MTVFTPWNQLCIRGFRGLQDIALDDLGTLNVLIGANDSGKTSVLEAVFLLAGAGNLELSKRIQEFRDFPVHTLDDLLYLFHNRTNGSVIELSAQSHDPNSGRGLSISTPQKDSTATIISTRGQEQLPVTGHIDNRPAESHPHLRYELTIRRGDKEDQAPYTGDLKFEESNLVIRSEPAMQEAIIKARMITDRLRLDPAAVGEVIVKKKKPELLKYLRMVNPLVQDISVHGSSAFIDIGTASMLPGKMFGSGIMRACTILAYCILNRDQILLVDEIGSGLHYTALTPLLQAMVDLSNENGTQIFVTTQSLDVLKSLQEVFSKAEMAEARSKLACYALERDRHGQVHSYPYGYEGLNHSILHQIEIR